MVNNNNNSSNLCIYRHLSAWQCNSPTCCGKWNNIFCDNHWCVCVRLFYGKSSKSVKCFYLCIFYQQVFPCCIQCKSIHNSANIIRISAMPIMKSSRKSTSPTSAQQQHHHHHLQHHHQLHIPGQKSSQNAAYPAISAGYWLPAPNPTPYMVPGALHMLKVFGSGRFVPI